MQHIAKLARLGITEEEEEKFTKELSSILDYFEKLKEVDVSDVEPTSHSLKIENVIREDKMRLNSASADEAERLMELAPETKEGYLKTKSIL